jgi:hypothetical protein
MERRAYPVAADKMMGYDVQYPEQRLLSFTTAPP